MGTDTDDWPNPDVPISMKGDRSIFQFTVTHDLGDRTLVVVILLAAIIGACGVVMGLNLAKQSQLDLQGREVLQRQNTTINQNARIEAELKARKP